MSFFTFGPQFFFELEDVGASALDLLSLEVAASLTRVTSLYKFGTRTTTYGPRSVRQNFTACEEEDIPKGSPIRKLSWKIGDALNKSVSMGHTRFFKTALKFNDHLLLKYPPTELGLAAHRDHSKYINLIVSITLSGKSDFNIHDGPDGAIVKVFSCIPGRAIFMKAPGFLGEELRPYHSVTSVDISRTSLILKQKGR